MGMFTLYCFILLKKKKKKKYTNRPILLVLLVHDFFIVVLKQQVTSEMFHAMFHVRGTNFFTQKNTKTRALWGPRPVAWPVPQSW